MFVSDSALSFDVWSVLASAEQKHLLMQYEVLIAIFAPVQWNKQKNINILLESWYGESINKQLLI